MVDIRDFARTLIRPEVNSSDSCRVSSGRLASSGGLVVDSGSGNANGEGSPAGGSDGQVAPVVVDKCLGGESGVSPKSIGIEEFASSLLKPSGRRSLIGADGRSDLLSPAGPAKRDLSSPLASRPTWVAPSEVEYGANGQPIHKLGGFYLDDCDGMATTLTEKLRRIVCDWLPKARGLSHSPGKVRLHPHWIDLDNFCRWAHRFGYCSGALLARKSLDRGFTPDNCVWIDSYGIPTWDERPPSIIVRGERYTAYQAIESGVSRVGYNSLRLRIASGLEDEACALNPPQRGERGVDDEEGNIDAVGIGYADGEDGKVWELRAKWSSMRSAEGKSKSIRVRGAFCSIPSEFVRGSRRKSRSKSGGESREVCREWRSFHRFKDWALASGFERGMSIRRKDCRAGWSPENCFFEGVDSVPSVKITRKDAVVLTAFGESRQIGDWLKDSRCVVKSIETIRSRLRSNWDHELALTTPAGKRGRPKTNES